MNESYHGSNYRPNEPHWAEPEQPRQPEQAQPAEQAAQPEHAQPEQAQPEHAQPVQAMPAEHAMPAEQAAQPEQAQPEQAAHAEQPYEPYRPPQYPAAQYPQPYQPYAGGPEPYGPAAQYGSTPFSPYGQQTGENSPFPPPPGANPPGPRPGGSGDRPSNHTVRTAIVAAVVAAVVGGGIGAGVVAGFDNKPSSVSVGLSTSTKSAPITAKLDGTVSAAAAKIQPSVVTINVAGGQEQGTGSGVIIRSDGYILTNNHVVSVGENGGTIQVVTNDGQQAKAKIVGTDPSDDLAVIKVDGLKNLTAATFGKSSDLIVGQTVVAVGAPLGLSDTVTSGIVSNTARPVRAGDNNAAVFNAIQTDAAINPGNSGGPLVDLNGNVVGINAAIATTNNGGLQIPGQPQQESGSIGIGFAIPSDEASRIAAQLIATGHATHAVIGATVTSKQGTTGAVIESVTPNDPAAKAGLKAGDVVTKLDDQQITDADGLVAAIRSHAPGQTVKLTYIRDGASHTVEVKLGTANN